jgi:hypothetical protein
VRRDLVGDLAHPAQFLVEFAALHRGVLFALVVRKTPAHTLARNEPAPTNIPHCIIS